MVVKKSTSSTSSTTIESVKHKDKRTNIPTEELRDFVAEEERSPKTILFPRDPSLDPQLVWKGKDEQDREDLAVPAVPIYIQEKIQPQAIIEEVRAQARRDKPEGQLPLFADFNGIQFEDLVDFYRHEQNWTNRMILGDIRRGFVYKRVPHVTLKSIANNPDITGGMSRDQIDAAIARRADTEMLYDQPYEDSKRIRVTGPFTVESLSPHRVLSTDEERPASEAEGQKDCAVGQFETMILDNLKAAGVQNTVKSERLRFDRLELFAGTWIQAAGEYTDKDGIIRRVAISVGPEHGTVGPEQVKEAAKEALRGMGFDLLIVLGFAFDAHAGETAKEFLPTDKSVEKGIIVESTRQMGKLMVLLARMNPDLAMGDELLKKTGAGNLFMVFGEPDADIRKQEDGKIVVEISGVDVYDPTTGQIRSSSTDDIACWFIDTDYNGESFFVRHAYFTGADEPYEKLKRALRAEIDEGAWASLYSTVSRPFVPPTTGKIAIKVINHYGDEVLKVFQV